MSTLQKPIAADDGNDASHTDFTLGHGWAEGQRCTCLAWNSLSCVNDKLVFLLVDMPVLAWLSVQFWMRALIALSPGVAARMEASAPI